MGANDAAQNKKDDRRRAKDTVVKRRSRTTAVLARADWSGVDGQLVVKAVAALASQGGAITLATTRDGGAFAVTIYDGPEQIKEYYKPDEDMDAVFKEIIEDYEQ